MIGVIQAYLIASELNGNYHVHRPFLHPKLRKRGLFRLVKEAARIATSKGYSEISWKSGEGIETLEGSFRIANRYERIADEKEIPFYMFYKSLEDIHL